MTPSLTHIRRYLTDCLIWDASDIFDATFVLLIARLLLHIRHNLPRSLGVS